MITLEKREILHPLGVKITSVYSLRSKHEATKHKEVFLNTGSQKNERNINKKCTSLQKCCQDKGIWEKESLGAPFQNFGIKYNHHHCSRRILTFQDPGCFVLPESSWTWSGSHILSQKLCLCLFQKLWWNPPDIPDFWSGLGSHGRAVWALVIVAGLYEHATLRRHRGRIYCDIIPLSGLIWSILWNQLQLSRSISWSPVFARLTPKAHFLKLKNKHEKRIFIRFSAKMGFCIFLKRTPGSHSASRWSGGGTGFWDALVAQWSHNYKSSRNNHKRCTKIKMSLVYKERRGVGYAAARNLIIYILQRCALVKKDIKLWCTWHLSAMLFFWIISL